MTAAGQELARLHQALSSYPRPFDDDGPAGPNRQPVHGDFRSANILVDGACVVAVLDFDDAATGSRIADLGKAAVLLATRYRDWAPTDPETRSAFIDAYRDLAPLTDIEQSELARTIEAVTRRFGWT